MKNKFTYIKTILFFYANIILNMLNLTFLFVTCGKTEIQLHCWLLKFKFSITICSTMSVLYCIP